MIVAEPSHPSHQRTDAQRNHERILAAARELMSARGAEVTAREVAQAAGVGLGTLYRHFSSQAELVDAVLGDAFEEMVALAEAALADPDPWDGFCYFLEHHALLHAQNRGLKGLIGSTSGGSRREEAKKRLWPAVGSLIARAQASGDLRADLAVEDIPLLFWSLDRVIELTEASAPDAWRRQFGLLLDGLRAAAARPLAQPPLTPAQLKAAATAKWRRA